jgi:hypothetical protein
VARASSSVDRSAAGARAGTCSSTASAAIGEGGAGSHLSRGPAPHRLPLLLLPPMTSTPASPGERAPAARAAGTPHLSAPGVPVAGSCTPSSALPAPVPVAAPHARVPGLRVWAGQTAQRSRPPSAKEGGTSELRRSMAKG